MDSQLGIAGRVLLTRFDEQGNVIEQQQHKNTITNWTRNLVASFLAGQMQNIFVGTSNVQPSLPTYIALGTGTGTTYVTDTSMFSEVYGTRKSYSYRDVLNGYYAQTVVNYLTTDPTGTFTEAGLWDQPATQSSLTGAVNPRTTGSQIGVDDNAPGMMNGQQIYISDGSNSEYVRVQGSYPGGAGTITLQSPPKFTHASGVTIYCMGGNLLAHVTFQGNGVVKGGPNGTQVWASNTPYTVGTTVWPPIQNGFYYTCTQAGTSGTTVTWPTTAGQTVTDGTVVWTANPVQSELMTAQWQIYAQNG